MKLMKPNLHKEILSLIEGRGLTLQQALIELDQVKRSLSVGLVKKQEKQILGTYETRACGRTWLTTQTGTGD